MEADDLTEEGMKEGVALSDIYLLFLSEGALGRPFVSCELVRAGHMRLSRCFGSAVIGPS